MTEVRGGLDVLYHQWPSSSSTILVRKWTTNILKDTIVFLETHRMLFCLKWCILLDSGQFDLLTYSTYNLLSTAGVIMFLAYAIARAFPASGYGYELFIDMYMGVQDRQYQECHYLNVASLVWLLASFGKAPGCFNVLTASFGRCINASWIGWSIYSTLSEETTIYIISVQCMTPEKYRSSHIVGYAPMYCATNTSCFTNGPKGLIVKCYPASSNNLAKAAYCCYAVLMLFGDGNLPYDTVATYHGCSTNISGALSHAQQLTTRTRWMWCPCSR